MAITRWSVWFLSTYLPSPSPLSICSCLISSVRSRHLKTTLSRCRSMLPWWGKIHDIMKTRNTQTFWDWLWIPFRSIFLKLTSLGIYLFFIFTAEHQTVSEEFSACWCKLHVRFMSSCFFSAGRTSWGERCTNWASSTSLRHSAMLFYSTSPGSESVWGCLSLWS